MLEINLLFGLMVNQRKSHNVDLDDLSRIRMNVNQLGVLSLYNRELSKTEVAEHFVEYQVKNFSNDEVLI